MSLLDYLFPEVITPNCPYGGSYKLRNDSLMMFFGFVASVVCFVFPFIVLKRKQLWPGCAARTALGLLDIADVSSTVTNLVPIRMCRILLKSHEMQQRTAINHKHTIWSKLGCIVWHNIPRVLLDFSAKFRLVYFPQGEVSEERSRNHRHPMRKIICDVLVFSLC